MSGTFSPPPRVSDPDMRHARAVMHAGIASYKDTFPLTRSLAERIFWFQCFHVVYFYFGGAEAVWRRVSAADPQEWPLEPCFRSALRRGSGLETIGIKSLEVSKPRY